MSTPLLSVVLVTPDTFENQRVTLRHLRAQSIHDRIEIVLVGPSAALDIEEAAIEGFSAYRVVEIGVLRSNAHGLAAGAGAASAPVVVFGEDHCFPAPGWAEALVAAHAEGHAVVGPVFRLANPESAVSCADFMMTYGPWLDPLPAGERDHLPGHNSAYKRDLLIAYGDRLESMLEAESVLHWDLKSKGHTLFLEPAAVVYHFNFSRFGPLVTTHFHLSRAFAAHRFEGSGLSAVRRIGYALGTPLLPAVRLRRALLDMRRLPDDQKPRGAVGMLVAALGASALGEAIGYTLGPGTAARRVSEYEYHRERHMTESDRELLREARFYP